jgi:hypothetical protein
VKDFSLPYFHLQMPRTRVIIILSELQPNLASFSKPSGSDSQGPLQVLYEQFDDIAQGCPFGADQTLPLEQQTSFRKDVLGEREATFQHLVQYDADGPDVGLHISFSIESFRRDVRVSSDHDRTHCRRRNRSGNTEIS